MVVGQRCKRARRWKLQEVLSVPNKSVALIHKINRLRIVWLLPEEILPPAHVAFTQHLNHSGAEWSVRVSEGQPVQSQC